MFGWLNLQILDQRDKNVVHLFAAVFQLKKHVVYFFVNSEKKKFASRAFKLQAELKIAPV